MEIQYSADQRIYNFQNITRNIVNQFDIYLVISIYLEWLYEGVEKDPDADAAAEKLDESGGSEQLEEADLDELGDIHDAPDHGDEVERVPGVFEVVLNTIVN